MSGGQEIHHTAALMMQGAGSAIKLMMVGEQETGVGGDLMSMELSRVGQQLQTVLGMMMFTMILTSNYAK